MSSSLARIPSPCSDTHRPSVPPEYKPPASATTMLKIHSLLNPESDSSKYRALSPDSAPPTPAFTVHESSQSCTPRPDTPANSKAAKPPKLIKDAAIFTRGSIQGTVNYAPFECTDECLCLVPEHRNELGYKHRQFQVYPCGRGAEGRIADYTRHIPYSSEKKDFLNKTGRDAFDVFQYTFIVPGDTEQRRHVVMWDYQVGLVRITPFFKACKYSKTTPAKALTTNPGLKDLAHSITGGSLAAQGYWMPYSCARAICLTFCYHIRWALTPIFGPSFITECLRPDSHGFARFKIRPEIVRSAALETDGWKGGGTGQSDTLANGAVHQDLPRSAPAEGIEGPHLRPRNDRPSFKTGSPFDLDPEAFGERRYVHAAAPVGSPQLSPKSRHAAPNSGGWTSINRARPTDRPAFPFDTSNGPLSNSLLAEPRYSPTTSWRGTTDSEPGTPMTFNPTSAPRTAAIPELPRQNSPSPSMQVDEDGPADIASPSPEVIVPPGPAPKKRKTSRTKDISVPVVEGKPSKHGPIKYTQEDARAAQWLLNLSSRDSTLASRPHQFRGRKRKASID